MHSLENRAFNQEVMEPLLFCLLNQQLLHRVVLENFMLVIRCNCIEIHVNFSTSKYRLNGEYHWIDSKLKVQIDDQFPVVSSIIILNQFEKDQKENVISYNNTC